LKAIRETFEHSVGRLNQQLEFATLFEDADKIEDRQRILKRVDDVITSFLTLVNEYYRMELMLRFKVGARQDIEQMEKYDDEIRNGFQIIDKMRAICIAQVPDSLEESKHCKLLLTFKEA